MKLLKDILYKSRILEVVGSTNLAVEQVSFDSREVKSFSVFVAVNGVQVDGHKYIDTAISNGAVAVVCEEFPAELVDNVCYVRVKNSAEALGFISANFYDNPSEQLKLVGVTGTNGKTSIVSMLFDLFTNLGYQCGLLSTVVNRIGDEEFVATHTTSDAVKINALLREMVDSGCDFCFMEVSSHALEQHRVTGLEFSRAVYTNITHDHLDYHKTFNNYIGAKKKLFDGLSTKAVAIVNKDDRHWQDMVKDCPGKVMSYSLSAVSDFKAKIIENQFEGLQLNVNGHDVWTKLIGEFNASNLLAIFGTAVSLDQDVLEVLTEISRIKPAPGRFQLVPSAKAIHGIVDYAHTPDALKNVLETINKIRTGNEKVITVVGCGGDRDQAKRPIMAQIAAKWSDHVIVTSDNPRSEDPNAIIEQMMEGLNPVQKRKSTSIPDRAQAIKMASTLANPGDIVLVAGKGHETYQEIKGERHHFDDVEELSNHINQSQE